MFSYVFMQRAFLVGFFISIIIPLIGTVVVNRKTSTIGDALSHTTLSGLFLGILLGFNPIIGGIVISVLAAFSIEALRNKFPKNGDMATAIIMSFGIGLASILSDFIVAAQNFESFLFGSIIAITISDIIIIFSVSIIVIGVFIYTYYGLMFISVDPTSARLSGVKVKQNNYLFTLLLAITIALSARIVGILIISSLMVLPVATAMLIAKNYKQTVIISILLGMVYFFLGLTGAFYLKFKPGGSIIMTSVIGLVLIIIYKYLITKNDA
ncbi:MULTISPECIES: metal ABC transporter permease [Helcococcus]|uniref:Metal ABC transporter permease n=1 Tax=Helcococcus bovis TaxID=3153252 RepID=A0ABW9F5M8_9FIRM